jgi:hypothetical protein
MPHATKSTLYHVLYGGTCNEELSDLLGKGHVSVSILGPLAQVYTTLRSLQQSTIQNLWTLQSNMATIKLSANQFQDDNVWIKLLANSRMRSRLAVFGTRPYFSPLNQHQHTWKYIEDYESNGNDPCGPTSLVFGTTLDIDKRIPSWMLHQRHDEIVELLRLEYSAIITTALTAPCAIDVVYLHSLVAPLDHTLFSFNLEALEEVLDKIPCDCQKCLIREIVLALPPRSPKMTASE